MITQPGQPRPAGHNVAGSHGAAPEAVSQLVGLHDDVGQPLTELDEAQSL
jgi:hypothetical protein